MTELLEHLEAARFIGAAPSTLKQSRFTGILFGKPAPPFEKRGRKVLYRKETLEQFNAQFTEQATTK
jgi:hypothetical protein